MRRKKITEEHIFGKWLKDHISNEDKKITPLLSRPEKLAFWKESIFHTERLHSVKPFDAKVPNVCSDCNNVWMSQLHTAAKHLIVALARGEWPAISNADCEIIARWAMMISINLECFGRILQTTQQQRTLLMNGKTPPGFRLSIGRMTDQTCSGSYFYRPLMVPIEIEDGEFVKIQSTYFCIENIAFHTLTSQSNITLEAGLTSAGITEAHVPVMLWPKMDFKEINTRVCRAALEKLQGLFEK